MSQDHRSQQINTHWLPTWRQVSQTLQGRPDLMRLGMNLWPPFLLTGTRLTELSDDWRHARVELAWNPLNRNFVGTQFGGLMFAMTDPFWMVMVLHNLGEDFVVWDKAAEIEFHRPGRSRLHAEFDVTQELLDGLRDRAADGSRVLHWCETQVLDAEDQLVATVRKQLYVRHRRD